MVDVRKSLNLSLKSAERINGVGEAIQDLNRDKSFKEIVSPAGKVNRSGTTVAEFADEFVLADSPLLLVVWLGIDKAMDQGSAKECAGFLGRSYEIPKLTLEVRFFRKTSGDPTFPVRRV